MNTSKKNLVVMGGLAQHNEIIEHAKNIGSFVIVMDYLNDSPGKKIADESHLISITDIDKMVEFCHEKKVDGIMNYCIDPGQKPYQAICEQLGLQCYGTKEQFDILTNKDLFYETCIKFGLDVIPRYNLKLNFSDDDLLEIEFPLVVKPADGRASKGNSVCYNKNQLKPAIIKALFNSSRKRVIFEKYLKRDELCAKYFVANGEVFLSSLSDTFSHFENGEKVCINGKFFPSKYADLYKDTDIKVRRMIRELGIQNGPLSFTAFFDEGKFRFFDPSFRLGGGQQWRIETYVSGVDKSKCLTNFALTGTMGNLKEIRKIDNSFHNQFGSVVFILIKTGTVGKIVGLEDALTVKSVIGHCQSHFEGDTIKQYGTTDQVAIRIHIVSNSKAQIKEDITTIQSKIHITDINGEDMLLPKFDVNQI